MHLGFSSLYSKEYLCCSFDYIIVPFSFIFPYLFIVGLFTHGVIISIIIPMYTDKENPIILYKSSLSSIPMMNIPIENQHLSDWGVVLKGVFYTDCDIV